MMIIFLTPLFDNRLCFLPIRKDPTVQTLSAERAVEALDEGILPRATGFDIERVAVLLPQPSLQGKGNKLRTVVTAQVARCAAHQKQPCQNLDDVTGRDGACDMNGKTFPGVLVEDGQYS